MLLRYGNKLVLSPRLQSAPEHQTLRLSAEVTPAALGVPGAGEGVPEREEAVDAGLLRRNNRRRRNRHRPPLH